MTIKRILAGIVPLLAQGHCSVTQRTHAADRIWPLAPPLTVYSVGRPGLSQPRTFPDSRATAFARN